MCERLAVPKEHRELARLATEFHTHCHRAQELKPSTVLKLLKSTDAFRRPERFEEFLLCCEADARGRTGFENRPYPQADYLRAALAACLSIDNRDIAAQGVTGKAFGRALDQERLSRLHTVKSEFFGDSAPG